MVDYFSSKIYNKAKIYLLNNNLTSAKLCLKCNCLNFKFKFLYME